MTVFKICGKSSYLRILEIVKNFRFLRRSTTDPSSGTKQVMHMLCVSGQDVSQLTHFLCVIREHSNFVGRFRMLDVMAFKDLNEV